MTRGRRMAAVVLATGAVAAAVWAAESREAIVARLWPKERIAAALAAVEKQKADGLLGDAAYARRKQMLEARRTGTFQPTALSTANPPLNFIQNGGFEDVNRNSAPNRSRWLWWGGWSWGGDYENKWEDRPEYVHAGKLSARIRCTGKRGRIGISTPELPVVPGAKEYDFTVWAKGEGENELFLNFESGAGGTLRKKIGPQWEEVSLKGTLEEGAKSYALYVYVTGEGTIWLDDAALVPVGGAADE